MGKDKTFFQKIFSIKYYEHKKVYTIFCFKFEKDLSKKFEEFKNLQIENNKIVFSNTNGKRGYGCNPKYIAEEIIKQNLPYKLVWLVNKKNKSIDLKEFPTSVKLVEYKSKEALYELATAKIWIDNQSKKQHIKKGLDKKEGQIYIQTWHGSLGIKCLGDKSNGFGRDRTIFQHDAKQQDFLISNSNFESNVYKSRFWDYGKILNFGHPRNDIFFKDNLKIKNKIFKLLHLNSNTKIVLYAPTYRNDLKNDDCYKLDYFKILKTLEEKSNTDFVFFTRLHHEMKKLNIPKSNKIINVTKYADMQELLCTSDILISDYSSCMFDYMLTRKPCFIFATDIDQYNQDRGFYYPLSSTPFPVARNNEELIENIKNFDNEKYKNEVEEFLKEKGCMEDGNASKRVVELIKELT